MRARDYFDHISCGYEGGVERPDDEGKDRRLRELINDANKKGDCIISARGRYYRPRMYLEEEAYEAKRYFASELHRARDILFKRMKMIEASKISRKMCIRDRKISPDHMFLQFWYRDSMTPSVQDKMKRFLENALGFVSSLLLDKYTPAFP